MGTRWSAPAAGRCRSEGGARTSPLRRAGVNPGVEDKHARMSRAPLNGIRAASEYDNGDYLAAGHGVSRQAANGAGFDLGGGAGS